MAPNSRQDTPPVLTAPPKPSAAPGPARAVKPMVIGAISILILITIGVVWLLPQWVAEHPIPAPETVAPEPSAVPAPRPDAVQRAQDKRAAEAMLGRLLRHQSQLMEASVDRWAGDDYEAALKQIAEGDVAFEAADYRAALDAYTAAVELFDALEASRPRRLADALKAGAAALDRLEADGAAGHFQIALALAPDNAEAAHGLARAQNLDQVVAKVLEGTEAAEAGRWQAARDAFRAAAAADPEYEPASSGLRQAEKMLIKLRFERQISAFYQALAAGKLAEAGARLDQARKLRSGAEEIKTARQRLREARQQAALEGLRARAAQQVDAEQWADAVTSFSQALKVDPNVAFAQQGLALGQSRARLDQAIERYLADPTRLYSPQPLARARQVLATAQAIEVDVGPRLARQRQRLAQLIAQATTPLSVAIASDGQTEVTVNRMAPLGRFTQHRLDLLPGDYVVTGSRRGYRDVRISFRVEPGAKLAEIVVICEERL